MHAHSPLSARAIRTARRAAGTVLLASAIAAAGCGSNAVNSAAEQGAQAICLSASAHIKDPRAKHAADNACRAAGSGKTSNLAHTAIQAAREACLQASRHIANPTARSAATAACPAGK
ncbi:MAG: hypothetical protein ACJ780_00195 [Solirubrobacteraceae bacterium]